MSNIFKWLQNRIQNENALLCEQQLFQTNLPVFYNNTFHSFYSVRFSSKYFHLYNMFLSVLLYEYSSNMPKLTFFCTHIKHIYILMNKNLTQDSILLMPKFNKRYLRMNTMPLAGPQKCFVTNKHTDQKQFFLPPGA